ncbi:unnamed protein product [Larinioides sclopetarius]|uniref:Tudor domain-containing protein n=1 Tax=Larinioides sclopetarius TaxID=280406 RepID=A0AAV2AGJ1_9ARAC
MEGMWKVGDYCRAIYSADKSYYEAKIISMNGDFCTVEFLGYGDTEDIDLLELKESEGKKARKKQIRASIADSFCSIDESEAGGETTDGTIASYSSYRKKKHHVNQPANNTTFDTTMYEATIHQQYPAPPPAAYYAPPPSMPTTMPIMAPPATMPQYSVPPAPPMPQCPSIASNPSLSSMLSSWYMAGYYTGIHSAQKDNRGCQRCCSHSNQCCRN